MGTIVGRNCTVQVALTFAAAINPTAVTKASPGAVTLTSHGLTDGMVGYWSSVTAGMVELQDQAFVVSGSATNTWNLAGLDTTDYTTYTAGSAIMASTWGTISEAAGWSVGGGTPDQLDDTRLIHVKKTNVAGNLPAEDLSIKVKNAEIDGTAMAFVMGKAQRGLPILVKILRGTQILRVFWGVPGRPGESVDAGGAASGDFGMVGAGWVLKPNI